MIDKVKPFSKKEICEMYGISSRTLRTWVQRSGLLKTAPFKEYKQMRILTTKMVTDLFHHFGEPEKSI